MVSKLKEVTAPGEAGGGEADIQSDLSRGPGWGGGWSPCGMSNLKNAMSHVSVANKSVCPLSNLRNGNVACHYRFPPSCCVARAPCRMSNLRNGHVAVSNLVVQTHFQQMERNP